MALLSHALVTQEGMFEALNDFIAAQEQSLETLKLARDEIEYGIAAANGTPRPGPMEVALELPECLECRSGRVYIRGTNHPADNVAWARTAGEHPVPAFTLASSFGLTIHQIEACVSWDAAMRRANGEGRPQ